MDFKHIETTGTDGYPVIGSGGEFARATECVFTGESVLFGRKGTIDKPLYINGSFWVVDTMLYTVVDTNKVLPKYLYYCALTIRFDLYSTSTALPSMTQEDLGSIFFAMPGLVHQAAIVGFLDRETVSIDTLITAKQRLLNLLAEKRRALITQAVTKGLDSSVAMKDSGISWLGEIPAHWEVSRLAWLFSERDERNQPDLPLLVVSIHHGVALREFSEDRIEQQAEDSSTYKVAKAGDISFNKMRMWQGAVGHVPCDGLVSPDYVVASPIADIDTAYYGLLFKTPAFSAESAKQSHGIVWDRLRLYWEGFRDITVSLPPKDEQESIVAYVEQETGKIDQLRQSTERTIKLLQERRAALISDAVTGKIPMECGDLSPPIPQNGGDANSGDESPHSMA